MDLSEFKLGIYDLLGLIIPGLIIICEVWITLAGRVHFADSITSLSGVAFTVLLLVSFGLGHLIQESADKLIKWVFGDRIFKISRDEFWATDEGDQIRLIIAKDLGEEIPTVDAAFDFCLTRIGDRFPKRDAFIATSDLCRSFVILAVVGIVPGFRLVLDQEASFHGILVFGLPILGILALIGYLSWTRMKRFRELSEGTVFRTYLASAAVSHLKPNSGEASEA